jgi:hypothetical protein
MNSLITRQTLETLYLGELKRMIAAKVFDDQAQKIIGIIRLLFAECYALGPTLRAGYGIGRAPEELIEFSEKIHRASSPQLRFSFETPVPADPGSERVICFVNAVARNCGIELSTEREIIEDAANGWHNFSQTSMFVVLLGLAFQRKALGALRIYFNLSDHNIQRTINRLAKILPVSSNMDLLRPLAALLGIIPRRLISLRGAALTYPARQNMKLYLEISSTISGMTLIKFIEECGLLLAKDEAGRRMLWQLLSWADEMLGVDRPPAWGLALEYAPQSLVMRGAVYLPAFKKTGEERLTWLNAVVPSEFREILAESELIVSDLEATCPDNPRFHRALTHVAICYDLRAREEVNLYWTLRANH